MTDIFLRETGEKSKIHFGLDRSNVTLTAPNGKQITPYNIHKLNINETGSELALDSESAATNADRASQRSAARHDGGRDSQAGDPDELDPERADADAEDGPKEMRFEDLGAARLKITDEEVSRMIPLYRNKHNHYAAVEHMFGSIEGGCAVGQTCFGKFKEAKGRFYSAATVQDTFYLSLSRDDIQRVIGEHERRVQLQRMDFLREIPEFKAVQRGVLQKVCDNLERYICSKGSVIFNMGDPFTDIFFIRKGEFQQTVKVAFKSKVSSEDPSELLRQGEHKKPTKASTNKTKEVRHHKMGILGYQKVIGLDELARGDEHYATTLECLGGGAEMTGELYRIDKEVFRSRVANQGLFMRKVTEKTAEQAAKHIRSIKTMHQTQTHLDDAIKKLADGNKHGENSGPFQSNKQLDKKLAILYADKAKVEGDGAASDGEGKAPSMAQGLRSAHSPDKADMGATMGSLRKSMGQPLQGEVTRELGSSIMQRPATHEG